MEEMNNTSDRQNASEKRNTLLIVIGWIMAILSLFVYPYFAFGLAGVIMGILATKNGSRTGLPVIVANIILMAIGLIAGGVIMNNIRHLIGI